MKILGISGSNRKDGNSYLLLKEMFKDVLPIETRIVQLGELNIKPCELCFESCAQKPFDCVIQDDFRLLLEEMESADGIVIACPFYFYVPSKFQAFMERTSCLDYFTEKRHGKGLSPLNGKSCILMAVSASGNGFNAFQILHHLQEFSLMLGMRPITTPNWPFIGFSAKSGDIEKSAILKEKETIKQAKELMKVLTTEMRSKTNISRRK
jgi:multimeric flavodoxin WrbA